jgi:hypothetical protein
MTGFGLMTESRENYCLVHTIHTHISDFISPHSFWKLELHKVLGDNAADDARRPKLSSVLFYFGTKVRLSEGHFVKRLILRCDDLLRLKYYDVWQALITHEKCRRNWKFQTYHTKPFVLQISPDAGGEGVAYDNHLYYSFLVVISWHRGTSFPKKRRRNAAARPLPLRRRTVSEIKDVKIDFKNGGWVLPAYIAYFIVLLPSRGLDACVVWGVCH